MCSAVLTVEDEVSARMIIKSYFSPSYALHSGQLRFIWVSFAEHYGMLE